MIYVQPFKVDRVSLVSLGSRNMCVPVENICATNKIVLRLDH